MITFIVRDARTNEFIAREELSVNTPLSLVRFMCWAFGVTMEMTDDSHD